MLVCNTVALSSVTNLAKNIVLGFSVFTVLELVLCPPFVFIDKHRELNCNTFMLYFF